MAGKDRLWLSGFATVRQVLEHDRLGIEELLLALEGDLVSDEARLAPWKAGFNAGIRACFGS
jgi:hypothetical protein